MSYAFILRMPKKEKARHGGLRNPPGGRPKANGREVIPFRLKPELIKPLKTKAARSGLSVSKYVERLVENDLKSAPESAKPPKPTKQHPTVPPAAIPEEGPKD